MAKSTALHNSAVEKLKLMIEKQGFKIVRLTISERRHESSRLELELEQKTKK